MVGLTDVYSFKNKYLPKYWRCTDKQNCRITRWSVIKDHNYVNGLIKDSYKKCLHRT